mmetsp:Transcript_85444/g.242236  ORF Transcript_85444/g.242236 Transcript_85444/m.242236 type:complete len:824 (+) Transcript_85444:116-2587(+)
MGVVSMPMDGARQLERAARLLDVGSSAPRGMRTPVRKSLEQMCSEARGRSQPQNAFSIAPFGPAGASRLLQGPQAQRLDREVADFTLSSPAAGSGASGSGLAGDTMPEDQPNIGLHEFFALHHERVLLSAVEEAHCDSLEVLERHSSDRLLSEWEEAKAQIMSTLAPQRLGPAAVSSALRAAPAGSGDALGVAAAPPQDAVIIDVLLREPVSQQLVQRVARLSGESCPAYQGELAECWAIASHTLQPTAQGVARGALGYLQGRFAEELKAVVYRSADARLGGIPDAWSLVRAFGRMKFETAAFPSSPAHVWFAAYVAARAGFGRLLMELPERAAPCSDRCPVLRTVCVKMAKRLQATSVPGQLVEFEATGDVDEADLFRADLAEESNGFYNVLVSLLLGRSFAFAKLPEATVEDWLWFRIHALFIGAGDSLQAPGFPQQLEALRQHVLSLPPSHYDPSAAVVAVGAGDPLLGAAAGPAAAMSGGPVGAAMGVTQTLNFVKVLLLTAQYGQAVQHLRSQDRCLRGPALHLALVLHRAGMLGELEAPNEPLNVTALVRDYASLFSCSDQLKYLRVLDLQDRVEALQAVLLRGSIGTNDELLGYIDDYGRHRPGLLERTLHEGSSGGDGAEFVELCARAGRLASERGQYREAIRLLHLGRCHSEVLHVLCRCLRLPVWREPTASAEAQQLGLDVQRFFGIYERNLDRYALSSQAWATARKLYAARLFHSLCDQGRPEAALDVFDREQLLPLAEGAAAELDGELLAECPRVVGDYVGVLRHAASQGAVNAAALRARVRQLQSFLAVHSHRLALDQPTAAALAALALC